ncbi:hypothetical protein CEW46_33095, partial [Bacillus cereus]
MTKFNHEMVTLRKGSYKNDGNEVVASKDLQPEVSVQVSKIVSGVARKYGEKYGMEVEDLQQELYLKLAEAGSLQSEEGN